MPRTSPGLAPSTARPIRRLLGWFVISSCLGLGTIPAQEAGKPSSEWIWIEGEAATKAQTNRHPWWYDKVQKNELSGNDWISNFDSKKPATFEYTIAPKSAGTFDFWIRANPTAAKLSYRLDRGAWTQIATDSAIDIKNIAEDQKIDLRFIGWIHVGKVSLQAGSQTIAFQMDSQNSNHGAIDCFVLSPQPFQPRGILKPGESSAVTASHTDQGWFAFQPAAEAPDSASPIHLRYLNEAFAGEHGFIEARGHQFVHQQNQQPVRFWGVNGPSAKDRDGLAKEARFLASYGVNLVRHHHAVFNDQGEIDPKQIEHAMDVVDAMKAEGIYTHFSIYFPLWLNPKSDWKWLAGYNGKTHPFAALYFNETFQERYRAWWRGLLTAKSPRTGKRLIEEPAVMGLEILNEDSFFFWTFTPDNIPEPQLTILEERFAKWLVQKYRSLDGAKKAWNGFQDKRDVPSAHRIGFRPLWSMANERTPRDRDTAEFLADVQRGFYQETYDYLRSLGFRGQITCSNWVTADPKYLGPIEKYTYTVGDFVDRHGYFACKSQGEASEWSVRDGHTWIERSALRFDPEDDKNSNKQFVHPAMDPSYNDKPSMISETTWSRPNRYRSEAPLYYAAYGSLQDTDAIVHFSKDGDQWSVKPNYFMQPWTLQSPAMIGQFPAAALVYRKGLIKTGDVVADVALNIQETIRLGGTPLPQDAAFDELRLKDVPTQSTVKPENVLDPLIHYVGRTRVSFVDTPTRVDWKPLDRQIDRERQRVQSSTGELVLNYGEGNLSIRAPSAQGASGNLKTGLVQLQDISILGDGDLLHVIVVSLDDLPIASSERMLLQVMTEEQSSGFRSSGESGRRRRIESIGHDPWLVREIHGQVRFHRADASSMRVTPLDHNGAKQQSTGTADQIELAPQTIYYLIESK